MWTFGAESLNDLLKKCQAFDESIAYQKLRADTLIFLAKKENYYDYQLGIDFYHKIKCNKKLILFDKENFSSDLHCQNGAFYDSNNQIFEWLQSFPS